MKSQNNARQLLEQLSKTGKYVFHGSPQKIERLEPRQQTRFNPQTGKTEPDGEPAICATPNHEIAIFRSLISSIIAKEKGIKEHRSMFGIKNNKPYFKVTAQSLKNAKLSQSAGYVHVFDKQTFSPHSSLEHRTNKSIKPVRIILVKGIDLPPNIQTIEYPTST